jgi:hypothetical protein
LEKTGMLLDAYYSSLGNIPEKMGKWKGLHPFHFPIFRERVIMEGFGGEATKPSKITA